MAYDKAKIIADALEIIEREGVRKVTELVAYLPIAQSTFYEWELDKSEEIIAKIHQCRVARKAKMRKKWLESDVPALQIAAYKLEADDEEVNVLSTSRVKQETDLNVTGMPAIVLDFGNVGNQDTGD
jgi:hypothetical protein